MKKEVKKDIPILPLNTPLILKAVHKETFETFEKKITYGEWLEFKKHKDYFYYTYQVI